jgi:lipooligosaccharide transport system permease protein
VIEVWYRNLLFFKKTFFVSMFWTVLEPLMYLGAFGFGFGRYVPPIEGLDFLDFYFPGLLCTSAMYVAYFESTYPNYTKLTHQKTFATLLMTPLDSKAILRGEILWAATKGLFGICGVLVVASFFGLSNIHFLTVIPVLFLLALCFAAFGMIVVSLAKNYDSFVFSTSGFVIPLALISGTFFSLKDVPEMVGWVAYIFPLAHATAITRGLLYHEFQNIYLVHLGVLFISFFLLYFLAEKLFSKRLVS